MKILSTNINCRRQLPINQPLTDYIKCNFTTSNSAMSSQLSNNHAIQP